MTVNVVSGNPEPDQTNNRSKNSLLTGTNLEQDQTLKGGALLMVKQEKGRLRRRWGRTADIFMYLS